MKAFALFFTPLFLVACAGANVKPIVDMQGVNQAKYDTDLQQCQAYATQQDGAAKSGLTDAAMGVAAGAVLGLVAGGTGSNIAQSAGVGAIVGGGYGLYQGNKAQEAVVTNCLKGRGYKVLN